MSVTTLTFKSPQDAIDTFKKMEEVISEQENQIKIEKAILEGNYLKLKLEDVKSDSSSKYKQWVHDDLQKAFQRLNFHLALTCEQAHEMVSVSPVDEDIVPVPSLQTFNQVNERIVLNCRCTGFVIYGANEGVQLIGERRIDWCTELIGLVSPKIGFHIPQDKYKYISDLCDAIENCKYEISLFLDGKVGEPETEEEELHPDLFEQDENGDPVLTPIKTEKKRGRKPKSDSAF